MIETVAREDILFLDLIVEEAREAVVWIGVGLAFWVYALFLAILATAESGWGNE